MTMKLETRKGVIRFPAFFPVTTFGKKFPLDGLVRPYLRRFAQGAMVSHFYAKKIEPGPLPMFIDSGGFASLFKGSEVLHLRDGVHGIQTREGTSITPESVLGFQEKHAEMAATLDFIVPPDCSETDRIAFQNWTIDNARWAITHRTRPDLKLFGALQAWDKEALHRNLDALQELPFDGFALGGMVPRIRTPKLIFDLVAAYREREPVRPLHLFGVGTPRLVKALFDYGVSSVDSSNYVRQAASRRYLLPSTGQYVEINADLDPAGSCPCGVCQQFSRDYLILKGELNAMALALHNLAATFDYLKIGKPDGA
jgi:helicase